MVDKKALLNRIIVDPQIMVGKPIIKGTRLTVQQVLGLLAQGLTTNEILEEYKNLKREDIIACLLFATMTLDNTTFNPIFTNVG